jgi:FkbM family methyltransferase
MSLLTRLAPAAFRAMRLDRLTRSGPGERLFLSAFFAYKRWIEDPHAGLMKRHPEIARGGHVFDVGANAGYTASVFAKYVSPGFKVYAFEPESLNFARMSKLRARSAWPERIVPVHTAVSDANGVIALRRNPAHPGDHRVSRTWQEGDERVPMTALDTFAIEENTIGPVKLVKIDVQGHELEVSRGMQRLIERDESLEVTFEYSGAISGGVASWYRTRGFNLFLIRHSGELVPLDAATLASALRGRGYTDVLATRRYRVDP